MHGCAEGTAEKSDFLDNFVVVVGETKFVQVSAAARHLTNRAVRPKL